MRTEGSVMRNGVLQEGDGRVLAFIEGDLHEAAALVIVDGHARKLPASALYRVTPIPGHPMTGPQIRPSFLMSICSSSPGATRSASRPSAGRAL